MCIANISSTNIYTKTIVIHQTESFKMSLSGGNATMLGPKYFHCTVQKKKDHIK